MPDEKREKGKGPLGMQWKIYVDEYDFLRGKKQGGSIGVTITLDLDNARKLSKNIKMCADRADYRNKKMIELRAHWAHKSSKGFKFITKVKTPDGKKRKIKS